MGSEKDGAHQRSHEAGLTMFSSAETVNNPHEAIHVRKAGGKTYGSPHRSYRYLRPQTF
jgi:hypothetical protein